MKWEGNLLRCKVSYPASLKGGNRQPKRFDALAYGAYVAPIRIAIRVTPRMIKQMPEQAGAIH